MLTERKFIPPINDRFSFLMLIPKTSVLRRTPRRCLLALAMLMTLILSLVARAQNSSTLSQEQMRQFLSTANVMKSKEIGKGLTRPLRLTLSDGVRTHDALFETIEKRTTTVQFVTAGESRTSPTPIISTSQPTRLPCCSGSTT